MSTPYEEISKNYSSREATKTDSNLAQDSLQLGGIDADEYATKEYVKKYADTKYSESKEYTDSQIEQTVEDLKGYTDQSIANIDLTPYAKKTDLQVVKETLQTECANSCATNLAAAKSYTDSEVSELEESTETSLELINNNISTINTNIKTMNTNIGTIEENVDTLSENYDKLFQSVSSGKSLVAGAITDKGVETSASDTFSTMAENISKIETEGTSGTGIDTSDATATASQILRNFTAYARGQKLTGSYVPSYIPDTPTYGTDTSDGTATEADIVTGKVAYVNGQRLVGTLEPRTTTTTVTTTDADGNTNTTTTTNIIDFDEIYALTSGGYTAETLKNYTSELDSEETITVNQAGIGSRVYTNDWGVQTAAYIVRDVTESTGNKYIYSNPISNGKITRIYYTEGNDDSGWTEVSKKFRYSYDELGLTGTVKKIFFGVPRIFRK